MSLPSRASRARILALLLAAVPVVFFPVVFGPYTLAQNPHAVDHGTRFLSPEIPFWDPAAASFQDEPWLYVIRQHLREGRLPLVNLQNALGATFAESLQPGIFYPGNLLLLLLGGEGLGYFDAFTLLHVALLTFGLFVLLRLYARAEVACACALLTALSGVTFAHANMVHYRGFAWLPLMLWGGVRLARGESKALPALTLALATLCAGTAGNIQDFLLSGLTTGLMVSGEALRSRQRKGWLLACGCLLLGMGLASPAFIPYLASLKAGNLSSVADSPRCLLSTPPAYFATWLMPGIAGSVTVHLVTPFFHDRQPDFSTVGFLLLCAGLVLAAARSAVLEPGERKGL
jgi:hypothetical protein